jgi:hypothetical protein
MCYAGYVPGKEGCKFFEWAVFDEDGDPPWAEEAKEELQKGSDAGEAHPEGKEDDYREGSAVEKDEVLDTVDEG